MKIPKHLFRSASFELSGVNETDRTVSLSVSNEEPYERDFGVEVLDHSNGGCDLSRMNAGAPLLWSHDRTKHLGTILEAKVEGGKLRVKAQIGENADANDRWPDIKSGVLRNASIGYEITGMKREGKTKDGTQIYRCNFQPYEASLLTVPAVTNVGIGRELNASDLQKEIDLPAETVQTRCNSKNSMTPEEIEAERQKVEVVREAARKEGAQIEQKRVAGIHELAQRFREKGMGGRKVETNLLVEECIREGHSVQEFHNRASAGVFPDAVSVQTKDNAASEGMKEKDISRYSVVRAMRCLSVAGGKLDGLEGEMSTEFIRAHSLSSTPTSFYIPFDVMRAPGPGTRGAALTRALATNVFSAAGALVGTELLGGSMIELLRNKMYTVAMGARILSGLVGNIDIPKQTGGATASWLSEQATVSESNQTVGQLQLTPHRLSAATAFTNQLLSQASVDVENFVREDLMKVIALARDLAAIAGTGNSGQPLGILNTSGLSTSVTFANAQTMLYADALAFENNVAINNADLGSLGYMTTPTVRKNAKSTAEIAAANSIPVWKDNMVNGYPARATNQVPTATSVIFGNWNDLILADWAANQVIVDPYSLSLQGQVRIVMHQLCDNGLRHPTSFSVSTN